MENKKCGRCKEIKPITEFYKNKAKKDGLNNMCKECDKERKRKNTPKVENLEGEIWKDIEGFEGIYQISNLGRIKKLERIDDSGVHREEKLMALQLNRCGYVSTRLVNNNSVRESVRIHRLVAQAFIFNSDNENKNEVNHIDGNKLNNNVNNLEWCTRQENVQHSFKTGLHVASRKCRNDIRRSKPVLQILNGEVIKEYPSAMEVSRQTGFSQGGISNCCRGNQPTVYGYVWKYKNKLK